MKSPPLPYPETSIDSYIQNYTGKAPSPETSPTPSAEEKPAPKP